MNIPDIQSIGWKASGRGGAVAAGGAGAVAAGVEILAAGGNAADAAVATLLALSLTDYGWFAVGGEVPFIIYDARRREVKVLSGQGRAPLSPAATDWYMQHGIPSDGDLKSSAVPGAIDLCLTALRLYGTLPFSEVVAPALRMLDTGEKDWYPALAGTYQRLIQTEQRTVRHAGSEVAGRRRSLLSRRHRRRTGSLVH